MEQDPAKINRIFLMLGDRCNLSCAYCVQKNIVVKQCENMPSQKTFDKIGQVVKLSKKKPTLVFFGGEPLLFLSAIKQTISCFGDKLKYSVITNGKLLNEELVEYLNENNVAVTVSYDGKDVLKTRHYDVFKDHRDVLLKINSLSVSGVLTGFNYPYDFLCTVGEFDKEYLDINKKHVGINTDVLFDVAKDNTFLVDTIDYREVRNQVADICADAFDFIRNGNHDKFIFYQWFISIIKRAAKYSAGHNRCGAGNSVLNIDMKGESHFCHNGDYGVYDTSEMCSKCEVLQYCQMGCPMSSEAVKKKHFCTYSKNLLQPIKNLADFLTNT